MKTNKKPHDHKVLVILDDGKEVKSYLMKEKLKYLGLEGLLTVINNETVKSSEVVNSLVALKNNWLTHGYHDRTAMIGRNDEKFDGRII